MDEDFSQDELKLAFTWHLVHQVCGSDGAVVEAERRFLAKRFPPVLLERCGFVEDGQFTARWNEALGEALLVLPTLPLADRSAIVDTLLRAALADDELEKSEAEVVKRAARLLGLNDGQYAALADGVAKPGQVRR